MILDNSIMEELINQLPSHVQNRFEWEIAGDAPNKDSIGKIANYIDHTLLKPNATTADIESLSKEALDHNFFSACIAPCHIPIALKILKNENPKICTVVGFPLGSQTSSAKVFEAKNAIEMGADEIDMVINISALKSKKYDLVFQEIETIKQVCGNKILKVIIETCYLTKEEIISACILSKSAGADFVKTSTGFGTAGATAEDISLMRLVVGPAMGVKASGGVRTTDDALSMINSGATRLGCSASISIVGGKVEEVEGDY